MNPVTLLIAAFGQGTQVVAVHEPTVTHPWYLCPVCFSHQQRPRQDGRSCAMTPGCKGQLEVYLEKCCEGCGKPLTGRSRDGRFCKAACRKERG